MRPWVGQTLTVSLGFPWHRKEKRQDDYLCANNSASRSNAKLPNRANPINEDLRPRPLLYGIQIGDHIMRLTRRDLGRIAIAGAASRLAPRRTQIASSATASSDSAASPCSTSCLAPSFLNIRELRRS